MTWYLDAQQRMDYYDAWDYPTYRRYLDLFGDRADLLVIGYSNRVDATVDASQGPEAVNRQFYSGNVFGAFGLPDELTDVARS